MYIPIFPIRHEFQKLFDEIPPLLPQGIKTIWRPLALVKTRASQPCHPLPILIPCPFSSW